MDTITPVASYIESHFRRMSSNSLSDGDTLNLIGGEGGVQVDVVFYLVSNSKDLPFLWSCWDVNSASQDFDRLIYSIFDKSPL